MSTRAADDFAEIRRNRIRVTRICYRKLDLPTTECWCMKAGPNGEDIPCSEARDPTPWERVELGKPQSELEPGPTSLRRFQVYECDFGEPEAWELAGRPAVLMHMPDCAAWHGHRCDCGNPGGD